MADAAPAVAVVKRLAAFFHRNGYIRRVNAVRRANEGQLYKKGTEVRLVAESRAELAEIRRLLKSAGFKLARPFAKDRQWRQPLYGAAAVARFLSLIGEQVRADPGTARARAGSKSSRRTKARSRRGR